MLEVMNSLIFSISSHLGKREERSQTMIARWTLPDTRVSTDERIHADQNRGSKNRLEVGTWTCNNNLT